MLLCYHNEIMIIFPNDLYVSNKLSHYNKIQIIIIA